MFVSTRAFHLPTWYSASVQLLMTRYSLMIMMRLEKKRKEMERKKKIFKKIIYSKWSERSPLKQSRKLLST